MGIIPADTKLTPRPKELPSWDSRSASEKKVLAAQMELGAAHVAQADYNLGRVLKAIDEMGQTDNTLVIFIVGDNGGVGEGTLQGTFNDLNIVNQSAESLDYLESRLPDFGTWKSSNLYAVPWAWATNTPFQWTKQVASHFGGTRNGMVMSWPNGIKAKGEIRSQFSHVIDVVPTILEAAKLPQPTVVNGTRQKPIEGVSMVYTFDDAKAPDRKKTQYFEIFGNSGIYHEGWFASTTPFRLPWSGVGTDVDVRTTKWELYNIDEDFSQANDLASKNPEKLREMQALFFAEAAKYNALPIQTSAAERFGEGIRPSLTGDRKSFTYAAGMRRIPEGAAPNIKNRNWSLTTDVTTKGADSGVIATQGGLFGGWAVYLEKGKPVFSYTFASGESFRGVAANALPAGTHKLVMDFTYDGGGMGKGGTAKILVDGKRSRECARREDLAIPLLDRRDPGFRSGHRNARGLVLRCSLRIHRRARQDRHRPEVAVARWAESDLRPPREMVSRSRATPGTKASVQSSTGCSRSRRCGAVADPPTIGWSLGSPEWVAVRDDPGLISPCSCSSRSKRVSPPYSRRRRS